MAGKLVFQTAMGGPIYTINADGSGLSQLTNEAGDESEPGWAPDVRAMAERLRRS